MADALSSLLRCERCGAEMLVSETADGSVAIAWPADLLAAACQRAAERFARKQPIPTSCDWFEQEIAAAKAASLLAPGPPHANPER